MDYLDVLEKTPAEVIPGDRWRINYSPRLADGETITLATAAITNRAGGGDVTATMCATGAQISGALVGVPVEGGVEGSTYEVSVRVTTDASGVYEEFFAFRVVTPE